MNFYKKCAKLHAMNTKLCKKYTKVYQCIQKETNKRNPQKNIEKNCGTLSPGLI